jgi:hypothetical protein
MRKNILFAVMLTAISAAAIMLSPKPLPAQAASSCPCNGGCEDLKYYSFCGNGQCSWFCQAEEQ